MDPVASKAALADAFPDTKAGRAAALYAKRAPTVDPVFSQIKAARGLDRFCRRGETACGSEWSVICATHNLLKRFRNGKAAWN